MAAAIARRELAEAQEEQLRLMHEVAALREQLADRDAELRRAIASKDDLVQQVAELGGAASAGPAKGTRSTARRKSSPKAVRK